MKLVMFVLACSSIFFTSSVWSQTPSALKSYAKDRWEFYLNSNYYQTDKNFESSGSTYTSLSSGNYYHILSTTLGTRWVAGKRWALMSSLGAASAESVTSTYKRTNSSPTFFAGGVDYCLYNGIFNLIPEFIVATPFNRVSSDTDEVLTGEGAMTAQVRFILNKTLGSSYNHLYIGYTYQDEGRAGLVPWGLGTKFKFTDFGFSIRGRGYFTASNDKDTNNTSAKTTIINRVNGGSERYYSINPSLFEVSATLDFYFGKNFALRFGGTTALMGTNTAYGQNLILALSYVTDPPPTKKEKKTEIDLEKAMKKDAIEKQETQKRLENFEEDEIINIEGDMPSE